MVICCLPDVLISQNRAISTSYLGGAKAIRIIQEIRLSSVSLFREPLDPRNTFATDPSIFNYLFVAVLIQSNRDRYFRSSSQIEKRSITLEIVGAVQKRGRFLKYENSAWEEVPLEKARQKVAHAIQYRRRCSLKQESGSDDDTPTPTVDCSNVAPSDPQSASAVLEYPPFEVASSRAEVARLPCDSHLFYGRLPDDCHIHAPLPNNNHFYERQQFEPVSSLQDPAVLHAAQNEGSLSRQEPQRQAMDSLDCSGLHSLADLLGGLEDQQHGDTDDNNPQALMAQHAALDPGLSLTLLASRLRETQEVTERGQSPVNSNPLDLLALLRAASDSSVQGGRSLTDWANDGSKSDEDSEYDW